jgi:hypothetical protein
VQRKVVRIFFHVSATATLPDDAAQAGSGVVWSTMVDADGPLQVAVFGLQNGVSTTASVAAWTCYATGPASSSRVCFACLVPGVG